MTEHDIKPPQRMPKLDGAIDRVCSPISEVNPPFVLVPTPGLETVYEFQSQRLDAHMLMFDASGNIAMEHAKVEERTACAFPSMQLGESVLLLVPEGARSLKSLAPLLSRNVEEYSDIFDQLGQALRTLSDAQIGIPNNHDLLNHFAFAADEDSVSGGKVYLVPPYSLDETQEIDGVTSALDEELARTTNLSEEHIKLVVKRVQDGWGKIG